MEEYQSAVRYRYTTSSVLLSLLYHVTVFGFLFPGVCSGMGAKLHVRVVSVSVSSCVSWNRVHFFGERFVIRVSHSPQRCDEQVHIYATRTPYVYLLLPGDRRKQHLSVICSYSVVFSR